MADDDMHDFDRDSFTHAGKTRAVFRTGTGPAVIVMAEMPGITPDVLRFARQVAAIGCTAVLPNLFGEPGRAADPAAGVGMIKTMGYVASSMVPACISREFTVLATGKSSPVIDWLRALAVREHERCGGPGVGAVGMCFTGGFALAMATDERLLAPVLSQPSLPFPITPAQRRSVGLSADDLDVVKQRCSAGLQVLGLRFKGDRLSPGARFRFLREQLGDAFVGVEINDSDANPDFPLPPHGVLTTHLIDEPGQPTRAALDQVLDLFRTRLLAAS